MRKKLYLFPLFMLGICLTVTSCLNSNNDDEENIDQEWKSLNEDRFNAVAADASYNALSSQSGAGRVYWKYSNTIDTDEDALKITPAGTPEFTDTVVVRYEGWYFDKSGEKVIFDSTENPSSRSKIAYGLGEAATPYPNKQANQYQLNGYIDGWITLLQDMTTGEEREVCIPQELAYGNVGSSYRSTSTSTTYLIIPAYTTIWFNVKLLKIIPMKGLSS